MHITYFTVPEKFMTIIRPKENIIDKAGNVIKATIDSLPGGSIATTLLLTFIKSPFLARSNNTLHIPIIGKNKSSKILQKPLLDWYIKLFENTLNESVDIWIIGYSFSDKHINDILIKSMEKHQSSLYVIDTKSHHDFMNGLLSSDSRVNQQLAGYFPCHLKQIFPINDAASFHGSSINKILNEEDNLSILTPAIEVI
jgi:hypothetical protein